MTNPYCASYDEVRNLYVEYMIRSAFARFKNWDKKFTREEVKAMLDKGSGSVVDEMKDFISQTTKKAEFSEFLAAISLADFYFPNEPKQICFEIKRSVKSADIKTYEDLIGSFEDYTHVDCLVKTASQQISFQVKRDGSNLTPEGFAAWLNEKVFKKYGDMKGTSLIVYLGVPKDGTSVDIGKYFKEFDKQCVDKVTFDNVSLFYNDLTTGMIVLHEFFPKHSRKLIDARVAMARLRGEI